MRMRQWALTVGLLAPLLWLSGCGLPKHIAVVPRQPAPPAGKALINVHRPSNYGGGVKYPIFNIDGQFICDIPGGSMFQYVCDPGDMVLVGWAESVSVVKASVEANKVYDIMVDVAPGWVQANIKLMPVTKTDPRRARLAEFERRAKRTVGMNRNEHAISYEQRNAQRVAEIKSDFLKGEKQDRVRILQKDDCR